MYAHHPGYNLEPKVYGEALTRGITGHAALEQFFETWRTTRDFDLSVKNSNLYLFNALAKATAEEDYNNLKVIPDLVTLLSAYYSSPILRKFLEDVIVIGVEQKFEVETPDGGLLPGKIDLLVKYTKGPLKGELVPVDNKFVYNFWKESAFRMNSQFPNYIYALRDAYPNEVISRGMVNQLRYRSNAQELFTLTPIKFTRPEITRVIDNHERLAKRATHHKSLPVEVVEEMVTRTLSKYSCENCSYQTLCKTQLQGGDHKSLIAADYRPNSYGYDKEEDNG